MSCERCEGRGWVVAADGIAHDCDCAHGRARVGQVGSGALRSAWKNSKRTGTAAERELAALLVEHGIPARRIPQRTGGAASPDVLSALPLHIEVKSGKRLYLPRAIAQAKRDSGCFPPAVFYQPSDGSPCIVAMEASPFLDLFAFVALEAALYLGMLVPGCETELPHPAREMHPTEGPQPARLCTPLPEKGRL